MNTRFFLSRASALLLATAFAAACNGDDATGPELTGANFTSVQKILTEDCGSCHGASSGRFFMVTLDSAQLHQ
ncbi:MAG: hypothetical protein NUW01_15425 [Gemmatimonadaceae bacterium]|nr:hypothetical protein [Gemmatimonadaceae bacterium]